MHSSNTWPRGLRLIFWCAVLGTVIDAGQILFYGRTGSLRSPVGAGTVAAFCLGLLCVFVGIIRRRRLFSFAALGAAMFSFLPACYFQAEFVPSLLQEVAAGRWPFPRFDLNVWYYIWNSLCLLLNAAIIFYIIRYEFRFAVA